MKNIELTEDHKSKLLEMCKELFPEYKVINFTKFNDYSDNTGEGGKINIDNILVFFKDKNAWNEKYQYFNEEFTPNLCIHWFEFCMTHLIVKLSKEFTKQKLSEADYTDNQYPNWFSGKVSYHLNPFRNEEFEEDILFIHPVDYLYEEFKKLK